MKEAEIRKWLKDKKLADEWWVMLDDEEFNEDPLSLDEIFKLHKTIPGHQILIVQDSEQETKNPKFITLEKLEKPPPKPLAKKLPLKKLPAKEGLPKTLPADKPEDEPKASREPDSSASTTPAVMPATPPPFSTPDPKPSSTPTTLPSVTIPAVTKPSGDGGLSAQLEQAKKQLSDCETAKTQSKQVCDTAKSSNESATRKVEEEEKILANCKADKEQRERELDEAEAKLEQAGKACSQATEQLKTCETKVNQVTGDLNNREETLAKAQTEQSKWKTQVDTRKQHLAVLKETAEKAQSVLTDVDDDEIFKAAATQANAASEAMGKALEDAREKEGKASREINTLTIEVADLKRQLNG